MTPEYFQSVTSDTLFGRQTAVYPYGQQTSDYSHGNALIVIKTKLTRTRQISLILLRKLSGDTVPIPRDIL
jgi:hypothetical protein